MPSTRALPVWHPLTQRPFLRLYACYVLSFLSVAMLDITVAWVIADSGAAASLVALVSTAATLPIVILITPLGALADIVSRRAILFYAQVWSVIVTLTMAALTGAGLAAPHLLLVLLSLFAISTAARLPVITALAPSRVDAADVGNAMTLLGVANSLSRMIAPLMAIVIIALSGSAAVFVTAAVLSALAYLAVRVGAPPRPTRPEAAERFSSAMQTALSYTIQTPEFRRLLWIGLAFFFLSAAAFALGPLLGSVRYGQTSRVFMSVTAAMGVGALIGGVVSPYLRRFDRVLGPQRIAAILIVSGSAALVCAPVLPVFLGGAVLHGMGWVLGISNLTSAAQQLLPDWIRARGMAITHMATVCGVALGAAVWGAVADGVGIPVALSVAGGLLLLIALAPGLLVLRSIAQEEVTLHRYWREPVLAEPVPARHGPTIMSVEYRVRADRVDDFLQMQRESRRRRLRTGAIGWSLWRDLQDPLKYTEQVVFDSLEHHQLHRERTTRADYVARSEKLATLSDPNPKIVYTISEDI
ncbi:MAG: MFS transporter [Roseitalea sp.]|jgi:MFS family permease|nr:MFS transporter [Roseitalea sp.]MBO6721360.1 MFS transporter [Roseitalea sp.]MBO6744545.1 MFS transporter [Roseitalea sp.]